MFEYMHTVLNGLKAWVTGEVNKLLSKIDNDIAALRKTLDEASSDFVINVNALSGSEVTVDKTYAQISEAIKAGKTPIVYILHRSVGAVYLSLFSYYENQSITFSGTGEGEKYPYVLSVVMTADGSTDVVADQLVEIAEDGTMRQVRMDGDPYSDMEIATKKYVDDHAGGGGSADAVLYTAQTLTAAQKAQARDNVDAAGEFVINATPNSDMASAVLDKTFAQIQAAIQEGKQPVVKLSSSRVDPTFIPLVYAGKTETFFAAVANADNGVITFGTLTIKPAGDASLVLATAPATNPDGTMPQFPMAAAPTEDMQIATKKYVDDKECILKSTTPGSTKKFKITVDDSGAISATEVT